MLTMEPCLGTPVWITALGIAAYRKNMLKVMHLMILPRFLHGSARAGGRACLYMYTV